jgi:dextranase
MTSMGYAAVYGAEPEYAFAHPDEMLYDAQGRPHSLADLFYIMNIHQDNPWRARILAEMAGAVRAVPFDGLHLDQYGFPRETAYGPPPDRVAYHLADDFPSFIDDARHAIREARPDAMVIFNAVENWPIEQVAPTKQDATYIEVWPPYVSYRDLQALILEARRLAPVKQVILAAYLKPLLEATAETLPMAEAATRLASAAIWANGGFHLLLGEANGALCDPYYPKYATLRPEFARVMRAYYDFVVRYENVLADRLGVTATPAGEQAMVRITGVPVSTQGAAGTVWTIVRTLPGFLAISLINLTAAPDDAWNSPKPPVSVLPDLAIDFPVAGMVRGVFAASPDWDHGQPEALAFLQYDPDDARRVAVRLLRLHYWTLLVAMVEQEEK